MSRVSVARSILGSGRPGSGSLVGIASAVVLALFDLDDTLVDRRAAFRAWAKRFCNEHGLGEVAGLLEALDDHGLTPRAEFFARVGERFSLALPGEQLLREYREGFPGFVPRLGEAVLARSERLRARGTRIGVVTNGSPMQLRTIEAAGLGAVVDGCCVSEIEGIRKPDAEIFTRAAARCGVPLRGGWMVGDSPEADVRGGYEAGLSTIWLRHGRTWNQMSYSPTSTVDTLEEALDTLLSVA